ncbi:MAG: tRNA epoxyqueuosine(34) reductase QueG [Bacteroidetes bacterium]|nr:tRNA epoxyqueuosine(34) reductase QueG [Bacteroidota bacterium]MBK8488364.1 tRNA epoxyqueuosine(34) reductase QueG [Bacteroidota bacterium]
MLNRTSLTQFIKSESGKIGFAFCGISKAEKLETEAIQLEQWLQKGLHGKMHYMENHFEKRVDPTLLVPGAKSVISLMYNYYSEIKQEDELAPKISMYAYGEDYHFVIKEKLQLLADIISKQAGEFSYRIFTDSAPVLEKSWAKKSGLGWQGKNTTLIHPKNGSYYFLAEIICDLELEYDSPIKDYCGTCTACIDACPTDALQPYAIEAQKCISYLTIEMRENIPEDFSGKMDNWMFGCDICQQVCPWNRFSKPHQEIRFMPSAKLMAMRKEEWESLSLETFNSVFKKSPVKRTKYIGLTRNIDFLKTEND